MTLFDLGYPRDRKMTHLLQRFTFIAMMDYQVGPQKTVRALHNGGGVRDSHTLECRMRLVRQGPPQ